MMEIKYKTFKIPKHTGGFRTIEQPLGKGLQILQDKLEEIEKIKELKPSYFAHAFMHGRNIVTCARQHFERKYILRIDIKDFFGSISAAKIRTNLLGNRMLNLKDKKIDKIMEKIDVCFRYNKKLNTTYLPQGSPTSPFLSNSYLRFFDWRAAWYCFDKNVIYNRYADDIYISTDELSNEFWSCLKFIIGVLDQYGLRENRKKRKLMHQGKQMNVVGIILNEKFQISKKRRKIIRAILHNSKRDNKPLTKEQKGLINFKDMVETYDKTSKTNLTLCGMMAGASKI